MSDVDLFVGQMIGVLPQLDIADADPVQMQQLRLLFPRVLGLPSSEARPRRRPHVYSLILNRNGNATLTVGGVEIPVTVLSLDVSTPREAMAFRIAAMAGRALRIRGVAEGELPNEAV